MEYTGMMYHVEKDGYWKTYYTVNKDSENYKKVYTIILLTH